MAEKGSWRSGYIVVFVLFVALLVAYLDRVNASVLIADTGFLNDMGIANRPDLRGLVMSVFLWAYGGAALLLSFALDKIGARRGLVMVALIWSASMFLGGIAGSFVALILSRLVLGIGEGLQLPVNSMVVKTWAPPRERGMANSIWGTGLFVGSAITMPLVAWIVSTMGWRASFFILGVVPIVIVIPLVLLFVYNRPQESRWISKTELSYIEEELEAERTSQSATGQGVEVKTEWRKVLTSTDYWLSAITWMLTTWMFWGLLTWLPSYLKTERGFTWAQMGGLSALPYLVGTVLLLLSGYLMFRVRRSTIFMWSGCLAYAISMSMAVMSKSNLASALWMSLAMGGICWAFGASFVVLQKIVPTSVTARATGLWQGIAQISAGFVPYIMGWIIALTSSFTAGFLFLIIAALLGAVLNFVLFTREGRTFGRIIIKTVVASSPAVSE
ncbi:MFS transporter [Paradesulfitobacterium ferrireducens]|uniref:MFS transporter n=1 Tax=Paradesulfitobacterium ferrireducens TaxID=2816476 RepID=UPI001A8FA5E2|nr:MFS transporter [Paradesulfitobacterium ferrireducens]